MLSKNAIIIIIIFITSCRGEIVDGLLGQFLNFQILEKLRIPQRPIAESIDLKGIKARFFADESTDDGNEIIFDEPLTKMIPRLPESLYGLDLYLSPGFHKVIIDEANNTWIYDFREKKLNIEYRKKCKRNNDFFLSASGQRIGLCDSEELDVERKCYNILVKIVDVANLSEELLNVRCANFENNGDHLLANDGKAILSREQGAYYLYENNLKKLLMLDEGLHYFSDDAYSLDIIENAKQLRLSRLFPMKKNEEIINAGSINIKWEELRDGLLLGKEYITFNIDPAVIIVQGRKDSIGIYNYKNGEFHEVPYSEERVLNPRSSSMRQLSISKNGKHLLAVDGTNLVRIFNMENGKVNHFQMATKRYFFKNDWVAFVYRNSKNEGLLKIINLKEL